MAYKSTCRACGHWHETVCSTTTRRNGSMNLRPMSNMIWGINGGMVKSYDYSSGSEQVSFKAFDMNRSDVFEYNMDVDCGCRYYVPSDNLEFLEWKYDESKQ